LFPLFKEVINKMKPIKHCFIIVPFLCLFFAVTAFSHDTDLYMASGEGVEPNILIIFDNSGSMNDSVQAYSYDPSTTYPSLVVPQEKRDAVYYRGVMGGWSLFKNSINDVPCTSARTTLTNQGHYEGPTDSGCGIQYRVLRTGNYRNYLASVGGSESLPKLTIAKRVISDFLDTFNGVRVGVMVFNRAVDINGVSESEGGRLQSSIKSLTPDTRTHLKKDVNDIVAETWTPLAETLYEAGLYFKGGPSTFNPGVVYTSPIEYPCQKNYVIIITDGDSTRDRNPVLASAIGDQDRDGREPGGANEARYIVDGQDQLGTDYLDDVARYLYNSDLSSSLEGQQNIVTYTIGFAVQSQHNLLERTATQGHGKYYYCNDALGLADVFQNIIGDILSNSSSFVAPIVPVSRMERTTAGDKIYLALFRPVRDGTWYGNIKKFGVAQGDNPLTGIHTGDVIDANGMVAVDSRGQFLSTARSFWSSNMDGGEVEQGGVGEILINRSSARNVYTYLGVNADLTHSSNAFTVSNTAITPPVLGLSSNDTSGRGKLINFVHGYDAYDDNNNGNTNDKRDWILGSFLHSRPLIVHYGQTRSVIFAGSNDGMLHAFDDTTGEELWGFIPPNLLTKLQALHADVIESFVDGSPKVYISQDFNGRINKAILMFGERRGGDHYYALDITDPLTPKYLWKISPDLPGYAELGQTWASPIVGKITSSTGDRWVAFIGGGYDENQDNDNPQPDSKGRAVFVVDVLTGSLVWRYSYAENSTMTHSIPSDMARVGTNGDGRVDRLYVGDMKGQLWRFDIGDPEPANWKGRMIFQSGDKSKIFCPPDVTLESNDGGYEMLFFGTGDREHPKESVIGNGFYAVKDKNIPSVLTRDNLVDVTDDQLQTTTDKTKINSILNQLKTKNGWYITLTANPGEKVLSSPVVFARAIYFTTFAPSVGNETDPCFVGEGTARVYVLQSDTGNALFNLNLANDVGGKMVLTAGDRSKVIGTAIPSSVVITFIGDKSVGYIGVGGGIFTPQLSSVRNLIPIQWQIAF
jgi:type IV pilus assembly protein PilY1